MRMVKVVTLANFTFVAPSSEELKTWQYQLEMFAVPPPPPLQPHVRAAAVAALNTWHTELTLVPFAELELLSSALETENPNLRSEVRVVMV